MKNFNIVLILIIIIVLMFIAAPALGLELPNNQKQREKIILKYQKLKDSLVQEQNLREDNMFCGTDKEKEKNFKELRKIDHQIDSIPFQCDQEIDRLYE